MNPRYEYGGDKYESTHEDDRRAFYERVQAEQEDIIAAIKTVVSTWTENQMEDLNTPTYENFIDEYPEWRNDELIASISEEMERVRLIVESEKRGSISGVS